MKVNTCCAYRVSLDGTEQPTEEYKLMKSLESHKIVLLREADNHYQPTEVIQNFHRNYVDFMFYNFLT